MSLDRAGNFPVPLSGRGRYAMAPKRENGKGMSVSSEQKRKEGGIAEFARHLRDHLVASAIKIETIDIIPAEQRRTYSVWLGVSTFLKHARTVSASASSI